jgi:hypothetical protein
MLVLLFVVVFNTFKLTHVFGSKVLVLVLVCYKLTLTPPSKHPNTQDGQWRNCCHSMAECKELRGSDSNVELNDTRGNETLSPLHT